jgi:hypothetical protein
VSLPKPSLTADELALLMRQAGLRLTAAQIAGAHEGLGLLEAMGERVRTPREVAAEPAHIFVAGIR